ncbi:hypothetical protein SDC9_82702 [bioreactor metagenome]|uniref:Uncharacterized protein n=1 Tax=bioreactor metagenome TaxID=1076179 RepID=A0A644Z662_9ZZZZ
MFEQLPDIDRSPVEPCRAGLGLRDFQHQIDQGQHPAALLGIVRQRIAVGLDRLFAGHGQLRPPQHPGQRRTQIVRDVVRNRPQFGHQHFGVADHGVEAVDQALDFAARPSRRHPPRIIAARNFLGRLTDLFDLAENLPRQKPAAEHAQCEDRSADRQKYDRRPFQRHVVRMQIRAGNQNIAVGHDPVGDADAVARRPHHAELHPARVHVVVELLKRFPFKRLRRRIGQQSALAVQQQEIDPTAAAAERLAVKFGHGKFGVRGPHKGRRAQNAAFKPGEPVELTLAAGQQRHASDAVGVAVEQQRLHPRQKLPRRHDRGACAFVGQIDHLQLLRSHGAVQILVFGLIIEFPKLPVHQVEIADAPPGINDNEDGEKRHGEQNRVHQRNAGFRSSWQHFLHSSTYPKPRTVWIILVSKGLSTFSRSRKMPASTMLLWVSKLYSQTCSRMVVLETTRP